MTWKSVAKWASILALLVLGATFRTSAQHHHDSSSEMLIRGIEHPEDLSQSVTLFHWLLNHKAHNASQLRTYLGVTQSGGIAVKAVIDHFAAEFNKLVSMRNANLLDRSSFYAQRDALVHGSYDALAANLGSRDKSRFDQSLENFKWHMSVPAADSLIDPAVAKRYREDRNKVASLVPFVPQNLSEDGMQAAYGLSWDSTVTSGGVAPIVLAGRQPLTNGGTWTITKGSFNRNLMGAYPSGSGDAAAYYTSADSYPRGCVGAQLQVLPTAAGAGSNGPAYVSTSGDSYYAAEWSYASGGTHTGSSGMMTLSLVESNNGVKTILGTPLTYSASWEDQAILCTDGNGNWDVAVFSPITGAAYPDIIAVSNSDLSGLIPGFAGTAGSGQDVVVVTDWWDLQDVTTQFTAVLTGDTACQAGCPFGAVHVPEVSMFGNNYYFGQIAPNTYLDFEPSVNFTDPQIDGMNDLLGNAPEGTVFCSGAGNNIFDSGTGPELQRQRQFLAVARYVLASGVGNNPVPAPGTSPDYEYSYIIGGYCQVKPQNTYPPDIGGPGNIPILAVEPPPAPNGFSYYFNSTAAEIYRDVPQQPDGSFNNSWVPWKVWDWVREMDGEPISTNQTPIKCTCWDCGNKAKLHLPYP